MKKTRLECVDGGSRKFWEVSTKGADLVVRFGRLGTEGQLKTKRFAAATQAEAEAASQLEKKLKKGYARVGGSSGRAGAVAPSARATKKKSAASGQAAVPAAFVAWLKAAASRLRAPAPALRSVSYARGVISVTTSAGKTVRGKVSAPASLLAALWRDRPNVLERVCLEPPGRWNDVITLVRCEGTAHDRYMDLVSAIHEAGDDEEARLAWLQAKFANDPEDREDPLFRVLFARVPRAAAKPAARSSAAHLKQQLPLAKSKDPLDALIVATELYNFMDDAFDDVAGTGKREKDLLALIEAAIALLAKSDELAVREMAKLTRLQFARAVAFLPDEPPIR